MIASIPLLSPFFSVTMKTVSEMMPRASLGASAGLVVHKWLRTEATEALCLLQTSSIDRRIFCTFLVSFIFFLWADFSNLLPVLSKDLNVSSCVRTSWSSLIVSLAFTSSFLGDKSLKLVPFRGRLVIVQWIFITFPILLKASRHK